MPLVGCESKVPRRGKSLIQRLLFHFKLSLVILYSCSVNVDEQTHLVQPFVDWQIADTTSIHSLWTHSLHTCYPVGKKPLVQLGSIICNQPAKERHGIGL
jgi:hypothetical protein